MFDKKNRKQIKNFDRVCLQYFLAQQNADKDEKPDPIMVHLLFGQFIELVDSHLIWLLKARINQVSVSEQKACR